MASQGSSRLEKATVIRGHHVYKDIWTPYVGEELSLSPEDDNDHDRYAVAVVKGRNIVGHIPQTVSKVTWHFIKRGGRVLCQVTGHRKLGVGLEVPCSLTYLGSTRDVNKLARLLPEF